MLISDKYIGIIVGILIIVILASGCVNNNGNNTSNNSNSNNTVYNIPTKAYSAYGVSFDYPAKWVVFNGNDGYSNMIAVYRNDSMDSPQFMIHITEEGTSDKDAINEMQNSINPGWTKISNNTLTIDGKMAYEDIFIVNNPNLSNEIMKIQEIFFLKNGKMYVLDFQASNKDFDKEKQNFDLILNSFKVQ